MADASLPPGPRDWLPFRLAARFYRNPAGFLLEVAREYGDIAHVRVGGQHIILLNHPDLIQDVLVTHNHNFVKTRTHTIRILGPGLLGSEGDFHLRQRRTLQPLFLRERVAHHGQAIVDYSERRADAWQDGAGIKVFDEMLALTQIIVGKTLFDSDVEADSRRVSHLMHQALTSGYFVHRLPLARYLEKLPLPGVQRFNEARTELHAFVQKLIDEHRQTGKDRGDILSLMLRLRDEQGPQDILTDELIRSQTLTLFVAGHETTAAALTWCWYHIARNPDVEAKLHEELDRVLGARAPTAADIPNLPYTEMVFAETMRLCPPVYLMARESLAEHSLGGYTFPPRTLFLISTFVTHHDARWFPDPERFVPERLSHAARAKLHRFAYFPFGGGPRQCIGEPFAWLEGVLILATLARRWRLRAVSDQPAPVLMLTTYQPKDGLPMRLEQRPRKGSEA